MIELVAKKETLSGTMYAVHVNQVAHIVRAKYERKAQEGEVFRTRTGIWKVFQNHWVEHPHKPGEG